MSRDAAGRRWSVRRAALRPDHPAVGVDRLEPAPALAGRTDDEPSPRDPAELAADGSRPS